jgi:hypothetical protein
VSLQCKYTCCQSHGFRCLQRCAADGPPWVLGSAFPLLLHPESRKAGSYTVHGHGSRCCYCGYMVLPAKLVFHSMHKWTPRACIMLCFHQPNTKNLTYVTVSNVFTNWVHHPLSCTGGRSLLWMLVVTNPTTGVGNRYPVRQALRKMQHIVIMERRLCKPVMCSNLRATTELPMPLMPIL